jgi:hypothetical protein
MTNATLSSRRLSCPALLCACAILLAWAAPAIVAVLPDPLDLMNLNQNHPISDRAAEQPETTDVTDDPVWLFSIGRAHLQLLAFSLQAAHLIKQAWTPAPPVRPPANLA